MQLLLLKHGNQGQIEDVFYFDVCKSELKLASYEDFTSIQILDLGQFVDSCCYLLHFLFSGINSFLSLLVFTLGLHPEIYAL